MNGPRPGGAETPVTDAPPPAAPSGSRRRDAWRVVSQWQGRFASGEPIDWFNLADDPRAVAVKANPDRRVWRVRFGEAWLYVKVFAGPGRAGRLGRILRGPPALDEWRCGEYAASAHVPCVGLVACGVRADGAGAGASVLITEAAEGAGPLPQAWRELLDAPEASLRRRACLSLADAVADLLAEAHAARFVHRDGHPGNILVRGAAGGSPRVLYVDLYGARTGREVSDARAAAGLAQLDRWFARHAPRALRVRFLKRYLARRFCEVAGAGASLRRWTVLIERAGAAHARRLYAHRDRRLRREGKYFARLRLADGWRATVALRFRNREEFPVPVHPDRTGSMWSEWLERLPRDDTRVGDRSANAALRRWRASGYWQSQAWTVFGSPAGRAFATGHRLRHRNIPCVWPLAALERRVGWLVRDCLLVVEDRPETSNLADLLAGRDEAAGRFAERALRAVVFESIGRLLAEMTSGGVRWPQPRPSALWVSWPDERTSSPRALIGRLDGISFHRRSSMPHGAGMVRALVRRLRANSGVEPEDCGRLTTAYRNRLGSALCPPDDWLG